MPKNVSKNNSGNKTRNDKRRAISPKVKLAKNNKATKKPNKHCVENIAKSKQLSAKLKTPKSSSRISSTTKESRTCGNGKPMPSLAELERMFEDSEDDESPSPSVSINMPIRPKTPHEPIVVDNEKLFSPSTIRKLSNKVYEMISHLPDPIRLDDQPIQLIVPQKRKKSGIPYIVGCKDRHPVRKKMKCNIGKGDKKFGIENNIETIDDDDDVEKITNGKFPKSIFNPKSDEIAAMLREREKAEVLSESSEDSNKTVTYEYSSVANSSNLRTFSPIPSTSKDNDTFLKNDMRFNESLICHSLSNDSSQSGVELIELPCETIIIDDDQDKNSCVLVKEPIVKNVQYIPPPLEVVQDDLYSSILLDSTQDFSNDDCEIIDVDDVIAENQSIINKYKTQSGLENVIEVREKEIATASKPIDKANVETNPTVTGKRDSIDCIVTDFFRRHSVGGNCENSCDQRIETIDLSSSSTNSNSLLQNIVSSVVFCAQSLVKSFKMSDICKTQPTAGAKKSPHIIDTIDLDLSSSYANQSSNDSVTSMSLSGHNNTRHNANNLRSQMSNMNNKPNENPVIIIDNVLVSDNNKSRSPVKLRDTISEPVAPLPPSKVSTPVRNFGDCPICMENLSNTAVASTICGHIFCMNCIKAALKTSGKRCPTCRKLLKGIGYHQLFL